MNQTSLVGRPLSQLVSSIVRQAEKRGIWQGPWASSSPELARMWASPSVSTGMNVNEETALTYSVFWACVRNISEDVASLPLMLFKREKDGGKTELRENKLFELLQYEPNSETDSMSFRQTLTAHMLVWGNAYAEIQRDGAGRVMALWQITPDRVSIRREANTNRLYYEVSDERYGGTVRIEQENMFHMAGYGFDGICGYSIVNKARESLGLGLAAERFGGTFFGNGATFGGVFEHPARLSPQALKNFKESVNTQHQGVDKAHKFMVVEEGMKYQAFGVPPNVAQFLETRQFQVEEICRWFRMPPHMVQHLLRTSYNSIEHQRIEYSTDTLRPICVRWERAIWRKLIPRLERFIQVAEHNMDGVQRGDQGSRYSAWATARQWGFMSVNEIRAKENMNPLPGTAGNTYLSPVNMAPADRLDEIIDKQVAPDPKPVAPAPAAKSDDDARMDALRAALEKVEAQITEHTTKAAAAAARFETWVASQPDLQAVEAEHRKQAEDAKLEAAKLQALLLVADEFKRKLEADREADKIAAEESLTRAVEQVRSDKDAAIQAAEAEARRLSGDLAVATSRVAEVEAERATGSQKVDDLAAGLAAVESVLAETKDAAEADRIKAQQEAVQLRAELKNALAERDALSQSVRDAKAKETDLVTQLENAEKTLQDEQAKAQAEAVRLLAEKDSIEKRAADVEARAVQAEVDRETLKAAIESAQATIANLQANVTAIDAQRADTTRDLTWAQDARAIAVEQLNEFKVALVKITQDRDALVAKLKTTGEQTEAEAQRADAEHRAMLNLNTQVEKLTADVTAATQLVAEEAARVAQARDLVAEEQAAHENTRAQLKAARKAERERTHSVVIHLVDSIEYAYGKKLEKECEKASRSKGAPDKLKSRAADYYPLLEDDYVDALRSQMRAYLAATNRSTEDVDAYTRAKIHPLLVTAQSQLRAVADGDPEEYPAAIDQLLARWARERALAFATQLREEGARHVDRD